jgi:hypothetical protein
VRHLAECETCRELAGRPEAAARVLGAIEGKSEHLTYAELEALADGRVEEGARQLFALHSATCPTCAAEYEDLAGFRRSLRPLKAERVKGYLAIATLVAAGVVFGTFVMKRVIDRTVSQDQARHAPVALAVTVHDAGAVVALDANGMLKGLGSASAEQRALVMQVLQTGNLPAGPDSMSKLRRNREVLLGAPQNSKAEFTALQPMGTVVPGPRPRFTWKAPPEAAKFIVSVYTANFEPAAQSRELTTSDWLCDKPLSDGMTYLWTVSGVVAGKRVSHPRTPEPEARFRVATHEERSEIEAAGALTQPSDLLQAALAARLGMFDVTRAALSRLERANPGSPLVASLAQTLK